MDARRPSSTKWTNFPKALNDQIIEVFEKNFREKIPKAEFVAEGRIYPTEVMLRIGYRLPKQIKQNNFEASMDHDPKKLNGDEMIFKLVDVLGAFLDSFLEGQAQQEEMDLPRQWQEHKFGKELAYLRYSTVNTALEAEADRLLGLAGSELVSDTADSEDALERATVKVKITKKKESSGGGGSGTQH